MRGLFPYGVLQKKSVHHTVEASKNMPTRNVSSGRLLRTRSQKTTQMAVPNSFDIISKCDENGTDKPGDSGDRTH